MVKSFYKIKKYFLCGALIFIAAAILCSPQRYIPVCFEGICLWAECVLPSLLPFMIICLLLGELGATEAAAKILSPAAKKMRLSASVPPLFLTSLLCGYPAGSRFVESCYTLGKIPQAEAKRVCALCSVCSPLFAIGTVGVKAFSSAADGAILLCCSVLSVIATELALSPLRGKKPQPVCVSAQKRESEPLLSAFYKAVEACLTAGAFICFFYTLSKIIDDFNLFMPIICALSPILGEECARALCLGLCEASCGCFAAAKSGSAYSLPACGFLITFGGLSIILQQMYYLKRCGVSLWFFAVHKLLQGALCFTILCAICALK